MFYQLALLRLNVWRYSATKNKSKSSKSMYKMRTETLFCKLIVLFIISVTSWRLSLVKRGRVSVLSLCFYFIGKCCLEGLTSIMLLFRWQIYEIISILRCLFEKKRRKILGKEDTFTRFYVKKAEKEPKNLFDSEDTYRHLGSKTSKVRHTVCGFNTWLGKRTQKFIAFLS